MTQKIIYLVGAQKAGTTTLFNWISQHPKISGPKSMKDYPFFVFKDSFKKGMEWFKSQFNLKSNINYILHGYVGYLYFTQRFIDNITEKNFKGKYIVILRNPVDRAYSNYHYQKWRGMDKCENFNSSIDYEQKNIKNFSDPELGSLTHIDHGYYSKQLSVLFNALGRENFYVILTEDLREKDKLTKKIFKWLELPNVEINFSKENSSKVIKFYWINLIIKKIKKLVPDYIKNKFSYSFRYKIRKKLQNIVSENKKYKPLSNSEKKFIYLKYYRNEINDLEKLLSRDLSKWKYYDS